MALTNTIALTSLATANDELGLTSDAGAVDARVERYILQVSEACAKYCERNFRKESRAIRLRGSQTRRLVLPARPLVSIASIVVDGTTLAAADYSIEDAEAGLVFREGGWLRPDSIVPWSVARDRMAGTAKADIVVFDPDAHWRVTPDVLKSAGKNTPFAGYELLGRARYTLVGGDVRLGG